MKYSPQDIWLPSRAEASRFSDIAAARKAASDYDPNLDFGFNNKTKQWCVFLKVGTMDASRYGDFPVLGFNHIPSRDEMHEKLYKTDALRRGQEILDEWNKENDALLNKRYDDANREVAEKFAWGFKKMGSEKAPVQVYMPVEKEKK